MPANEQQEMRDVPPKLTSCMQIPGEYDEQKQASFRQLKIT